MTLSRHIGRGGRRPNSGRKPKCLCGRRSCPTCNHPGSAYRIRHTVMADGKPTPDEKG